MRGQRARRPDPAEQQHRPEPDVVACPGAGPGARLRVKRYNGPGRPSIFGCRLPRRGRVFVTRFSVNGTATVAYGIATVPGCGSSAILASPSGPYREMQHAPPQEPDRPHTPRPVRPRGVAGQPAVHEPPILGDRVAAALVGHAYISVPTATTKGRGRSLR